MADAAPVPDDGIDAIRHLLTVCGFSGAQRTAITHTEGLNDIRSLSTIAPSDVRGLTENLSRLQVQRGGAYIGTYQATNLRALLWWLRDLVAQGTPGVPGDWNNDVLLDARARMDIEKQTKDKTSDIEAPKKLIVAKWRDGYLGLMNFLRSKRSADGKRMLDYVVRRDVPPGWVPLDRDDRLVYGSPLEGANYDADNTSVFQIIKQWTLNTQAFTWVRPFDRNQDGRAAINALRAHYDGPGEVAKNLAKAEAELKTIHYKGEQSFSFEGYINKLNEIYFAFAEAKQPIFEDQKVKYMCEKINSSNQRLQTAVTVIKMDNSLRLPPDQYFVQAANRLAEQVAIIFPNVRARTGRYVSSTGRGGRGGRNGRGGRSGRGGRGGRGGGRAFPPNLGGNPGDTWNGTDISDLTIHYPARQFNSFPYALKKKIWDAKGTYNGGKRNISQAQCDDATETSGLTGAEIAVLRAVAQASVENDDDGNATVPTSSAASSFGRSGHPPAKRKKG